MRFRCVLLPERNRFVKIFFKGKAGVAGILYPTRSFGRADHPRFAYAHRVQLFGRFQHYVAVLAVHVGLHFDGKPVFNTVRNRIQRNLLGTLMIPHPIVITDAVKGYFHERDAADAFQALKRRHVYEMTVCIQLFDEHSARIDAFNNFKEIFVQHRLAAGDCERIDSAIARLIEKRIHFIHSPFAHQRGIVRGIEAMNTIIIAFARYHQIHCGKITVFKSAGVAPIGEVFSARRFMDKAFFNEFVCESAFVFCQQVGFSVTRRQKFKFFFFQSCRIAFTLYVIGVGDELP